MKHIFSIFATATLILFSGCKWFNSCCSDHSNIASETVKSETVKKAHAHTHVTVVRSESEFNEHVVKSSKPVVVDFTAKWCGACQTMAPIFDALAHELHDKYAFIKVDVDAAPDIANSFKIKGIPTFSFFKDGKEVVAAANRIVGSVDKNALKSAIEKNLQ